MSLSAPLGPLSLGPGGLNRERSEPFVCLNEVCSDGGNGALLISFGYQVADVLVLSDEDLAEDVLRDVSRDEEPKDLRSYCQPTVLDPFVVCSDVDQVVKGHIQLGNSDRVGVRAKVSQFIKHCCHFSQILPRSTAGRMAHSKDLKRQSKFVEVLNVFNREGDNHKAAIASRLDQTLPLKPFKGLTNWAATDVVSLGKISLFEVVVWLEVTGDDFFAEHIGDIVGYGLTCRGNLTNWPSWIWSFR